MTEEAKRRVSRPLPADADAQEGNMSRWEDHDEDARRDAIDERLARRGGCGGRGYVPVRGEPMAANPCDCPACNPRYGEEDGE